MVASSHQSHAYADGACLYFTFAARPPVGDGPKLDDDARRAWTGEYYRRAWDEVTGATQAAGGAISRSRSSGSSGA